MRLVDDDETDVHHVEIGTEQRSIEPLGRDIQELASAVCGVVQGQVHLPPVHPGMDAKGLDAPGIEVLDLVLHKGDERGDDQREAFAHQGRDLEADGLAASRREDGEHVPAVQRGLYDLSLHGPERVESPVFLEYFRSGHEPKSIKNAKRLRFDTKVTISSLTSYKK